MRPAFTDSRTSIKIRGKAVPSADESAKKLFGFDQELFSESRVLCIRAGGVNSQIAPTLVRKGIGQIALLEKISSNRAI